MSVNISSENFKIYELIFLLISGIEGGEAKKNQNGNEEYDSRIVTIFVFIIGLGGVLIFWYMMWNYNTIVKYSPIKIDFLLYFPIIVYLWGSSILTLLNIINELKK